MQIQSVTGTTDPTQTGSAATAPAASTTDSTSDSTTDTTASSIDGLANESTFLQLLVTQIQNQDPLNPTDSTQFLSQLAQFSQLEQLIGIRQELTPQTAAADPATTTTPTTTPATN